MFLMMASVPATLVHPASSRVPLPRQPYRQSKTTSGSKNVWLFSTVAPPGAAASAKFP